MRDFRQLQVWQKSHQVVLATYKATGSFPKQELYGLTNQIRRASASIAANIAEGCGRSTEAELARFMEISMGSASELAYFLILSYDLKLLDHEGFTQLAHQVDEVQRMLRAYINKLRQSASG